MPKICKKSWKIDGEYREFEVHYSVKSGFYIKDFPDEIWRVGTDNGWKGHHSTERGLYEAVFTALNQYHERKASTKKVIWVKLQLGTNYRMNRVSEGSWSGIRKEIGMTSELASKTETGGMSSIPEDGISLSYRVGFLETKNGDQFHGMTKDGLMGNRVNRNPESMILIDYSEEREKFLIECMNTMDKLARGLIKFFGSDQETLTSLIDSRTPLLQYNNEEKKP